MVFALAMIASVAPASAAGGVRPFHRAPPPGHVSVFHKLVVGGSNAQMGSFPWLAMIYSVSANTDGLCTGSVVAANVVLTAAHCVIDESTGRALPQQDFGVVTGTLNWAEAAGRHVSGVAQVVVNPGFENTTGEDDAALLILGSSTSAPSLPLASASDSALWSPGSQVVFAGWGQTSGTDGNSTANQLQWATTVVHDTSYCAASTSPYDPGYQLCARDAPYDDTSVCSGDSGGPLIANELQGQTGAPVEIGIVRSAVADCAPTDTSVFTRVDAISTWADGVITAAAGIQPSFVAAPPLPVAVFAMTRLDMPTAKGLVVDELSGRFGTRFTHRRRYRTDCTRDSEYRVTCGVAWSHGSNEYWGTVSVNYEIADASFVWSDRYAIKWTNVSCYLGSGHPRACRIYHVRGS